MGRLSRSFGLFVVCHSKSRRTNLALWEMARWLQQLRCIIIISKDGSLGAALMPLSGICVHHVVCMLYIQHGEHYNGGVSAHNLSGLGYKDLQWQLLCISSFVKQSHCEILHTDMTEYYRSFVMLFPLPY